MNRRSRSDAHSSRTDDHCPSTVCFHSLSICMRESSCKDGDGGGDAAGSAKVGHVDSIGNGEDLTRPSSAMTLDLSTDIVLCAAVCWACNERDSSTVDSSWFDRVVSHSNSWSMYDRWWSWWTWLLVGVFVVFLGLPSSTLPLQHAPVCEAQSFRCSSHHSHHPI